jgi:hypothetical protein
MIDPEGSSVRSDNFSDVPRVSVIPLLLLVMAAPLRRTIELIRVGHMSPWDYPLLTTQGVLLSGPPFRNKPLIRAIFKVKPGWSFPPSGSLSLFHRLRLRRYLVTVLSHLLGPPRR